EVGLMPTTDEIGECGRVVALDSCRDLLDNLGTNRPAVIAQVGGFGIGGGLLPVVEHAAPVSGWTESQNQNELWSEADHLSAQNGHARTNVAYFPRDGCAAPLRQSLNSLPYLIGARGDHGLVCVKRRNRAATISSSQRHGTSALRTQNLGET